MNNRYILRTVFSQKKVVNHPNNYLNQIESRTDSHKIKEFLDIFVPFLLLVIIFYYICLHVPHTTIYPKCYDKFQTKFLWNQRKIPF